MGSGCSYKTGMLRIEWVVVCVLISMGLFSGGCTTWGLHDPEAPPLDKSMVLGFIQVESNGPYFRMHQTEAAVRFFDVRHINTGKRTRVLMTENGERFVTELSPGHYELFRVQIGEGPFRSEAIVKMNFDVVADKAIFLGVWHLRVDPPKTVRMLNWEVRAKTLNGDPAPVLKSILGDHALEVSLPKPESTQNRLFAVAPSQPRAKYFYRR